MLAYIKLLKLTKRVSTTIFMLLSLSCTDEQKPKPEIKDQDAVCGEKVGNISNLIGLNYGYQRPFIPFMTSGLEADPLPLRMEYGLQGGHHVDISLRFTGSFNPDIVDIQIELKIDPPFQDLYYGIHNTLDWYLLYPQDNELEGCYFHNARIFLFDQMNAPLEATGVQTLDGTKAQLYITLITDDATTHEWTSVGILNDATVDQ